MRKLNKIEINALRCMSICDKEKLLSKKDNKRVKAMPSYKKSYKILMMDCQTRENKFGKNDSKVYKLADNTWHKVYVSAIKRAPKLYIEKIEADKNAYKKFTNEDVELFRQYVYANEFDVWYDDGYGSRGAEEKANHWLTAGRRKILNEIFWVCDTEEERTELLEQRRNNNDR